MMLSCWLTWYVWFKVVHLSHVDQFGNFIYKNKKTEFLVLSLYPPSYQSIWYYPIEKSHAMSLGYMLSLIKFCDPLWFYSVYALDLRFYVQMNLVLLKYCLTIVFKRERERERWKDGMPKKHDPANKVRHEKEHVIICALD